MFVFFYHARSRDNPCPDVSVYIFFSGSCANRVSLKNPCTDPIGDSTVSSENSVEGSGAFFSKCLRGSVPAYPRDISQRYIPATRDWIRNFSSRRASRPACVPNRLQLELRDFIDDEDDDDDNDDDDDDDKVDDDDGGDDDDDDETRTMATTNRRNLACPRMDLRIEQGLQPSDRPSLSDDQVQHRCYRNPRVSLHYS